MPTALEALTAGLDSATVGALGDTFDYQPSGGSRTTIVGFVEHEEVKGPGGMVGAIGQDVQVEAFFDAIPVKPTEAARVWLPKYPGRIWKPVNVRLNEAGTGWLFELQKP